MGEFADYTNMDRMSEWELAMDNEFASLDRQYELGLCDELGYQFYPGTPAVNAMPFNPIRSMKAIGPGLCPLCNDNTHLVKGQYGNFYGCNSFPKCKGSRNYE